MELDDAEEAADQSVVMLVDDEQDGAPLAADTFDALAAEHNKKRRSQGGLAAWVQRAAAPGQHAAAASGRHACSSKGTIWELGW
jgi:hypothetical protein